MERGKLSYDWLSRSRQVPAHTLSVFPRRQERCQGAEGKAGPDCRCHRFLTHLFSSLFLIWIKAAILIFLALPCRTESILRLQSQAYLLGSKPCGTHRQGEIQGRECAGVIWGDLESEIKLEARIKTDSPQAKCGIMG